MHFEGENSSFDIPKMRTSIPDTKGILEHLTETQAFLKVNFIVPNNFKMKIQ